MVPTPGEGCLLIKRTLLVAFAFGLMVVGVAKPNRAGKTHKPHSSSKIVHRKKVVPYAVRKGDTDETIAKRAGLTVRQLRHLNGAKPLEVIREGQQLNVMKTVAVRLQTKAKPVKKSAAEHKASAQARLERAAKAEKAKRVAKASQKAKPAKKRPRIALVEPRRKTPAPPKPAPAKVATTSSGKGDVTGILSKANSFRGVRYRYGAMSRSATDCSGFTSQVFRANGYRIPRTAAEQSRVGQYVSRGDLRPGDLVFFKTIRGTRVSHVGIYVGDNSFIHASSGGGRVMISSLGQAYYNARFVTARRIAAGSGSFEIVDTAREAEKTQQVPVDPEPQQSATDEIGN